MEEIKTIKLKSSTHILFACLLLSPIALAWTWSIYIGLFKATDTFRIFFYPKVIPLVFLTVGSMIIFYAVLMHLITKTPLNEEGFLKLRKYFLILETFLMGVALLNGFLIPCVVTTGAYWLGINVHFSSLLMITVGFCFMLCTYFYIWYLHIFERQVADVPLIKKDIKISINGRGTMVATFGAIGMALTIIGSIYAGIILGTDIQTILTKHVFKMVFLGVIAVGSDVFITILGFQRQVKIISGMAKSLAQKDYTIETLKITTRDEFGLLLNDLNAFYSSTKELLKIINVSVSETATSSDTFAEKMEESAKDINEIVVNIDEIKGKIENQSVSVDNSYNTVNSMLEQIENLNKVVNSQATGVAESSAAVEEMVANIQSVTKTLQTNEVSVKELGSRSEEGRVKVNNSVELAASVMERSESLKEASAIIQSIAEQTNLLAMNAAIEAAHAGESGKGFAVVADEIRKLAEESNVQGAKITEQLESFQSALSGVNENIQTIQTAFDEIFNLTQVVKDKESIIKNAMDEQSSGSTQVLQAMSEIKETSLVIKEASDLLNDGGKKIGDEMQRLAEITNDVGNVMTEISASTDKITSATKDVTEGSLENKIQMLSIQEEVSQFKIK